MKHKRATRRDLPDPSVSEDLPSVLASSLRLLSGGSSTHVDAAYEPAGEILAVDGYRATEGIRAFFERSVDALFVVTVDINGKFHLDEWNQSFARLVKLKLRATHGALPEELLPVDLAKSFTDGMRRCVETDRGVQLELRIAAASSIRRWQFQLTPVHGFLGRLERILGHGRDVTDQHEQTSRLERSYRLLERTALTTRDVLYVLDRVDKRSVYVSRRVFDVIGYRPEELRGMSGELLTRLIHPDDLPRLLGHYHLFDELKFGQVLSIDYRVRHANGRYVWLSSKDTILSRDSSGFARRIIGCAADITDQRHALSDMKRITKRLLRTQDEERRRIARELHDSTAQHLVVIGIDLSRLDVIKDRDADAQIGRADIQDILAEMRRSMNEAQQEIRALTYLLHPPTLERMGIGETLRRFIIGFARRTGIHAKLTIEKTFTCRSRDIAMALMRISQEALINVYRHADASKVDIKLGSDDGKLVLEIEDDGKGIGPAMMAADDDVDLIGVGIPGMRARVRQFRGELQILRGRHGLLVRATIPERASSLD